MDKQDVIICPTTGERLVPEHVWESQLPDGRSIRYGRFKQHFHGGQECDWSHLVQPVEQVTPGFGFSWL